MLKITIELVPFGVGTPVVIADMKLWNDGTGNVKTGNYKFNMFGKKHKLMKTGEIKQFARTKEHVWKLLYLALKEIYEPKKEIQNGTVQT